MSQGQYKRSKTMERKLNRAAIASKIKSHLSDTGREHGGLFDCGELGCCLIYWSRGQWREEWHELERPPWEVE